MTWASTIAPDFSAGTNLPAPILATQISLPRACALSSPAQASSFQHRDMDCQCERYAWVLHCQSRYHQFVKHDANPVLPDAQLYGTVLPGPRGEGFRMWHDCNGPSPACYANSTDGLRWERPALNLVADRSGLGERNALFTRFDSTHTVDSLCTASRGMMTNATKHSCREGQPSVILLPGATSGAPEQWELFNWNYGQDVDAKCPPGRGPCDKDGYFRSSSIDGIHWHDDVAHNPVLPTDPPHNRGDVSSFVYDHFNMSFMATIKMWFSASTPARYQLPRRSIGLAHTKDPSRWPQPSLVLQPDAVDDGWASSTSAQSQHNRASHARIHSPMSEWRTTGELNVLVFAVRRNRALRNGCVRVSDSIHRVAVGRPLY